jgi:hypothetical protein
LWSTMPLQGTGGPESDQVMVGPAIASDLPPKRALPHSHHALLLSCSPHLHGRAWKFNEETAASETDADSDLTQLGTNQVPDKDGR